MARKVSTPPRIRPARRSEKTRHHYRVRKIARGKHSPLPPPAIGLSRQELRSRAEDSFLALEEAREIRSGGRYQAEGITSRRSEGFFNRIEVNWLRHEATIYDDELTEYFNQVGVGHAVDIVREHVYGIIADAYPHLRDECDRQLEQRRENAAWRYGTDVSKH